MTYVNQLTGYDPVKDAAYFCFRCALKSRGWKLTGVGSPPAPTADP